MNITVYLGALEGKDPALKRAVRELGTWIGESGNALVYGGSRSGLMGEIAESVLQAGGKNAGIRQRACAEEEGRARPIALGCEPIREAAGLISGDGKDILRFGKANAGI